MLNERIVKVRYSSILLSLLVSQKDIQTIRRFDYSKRTSKFMKRILLLLTNFAFFIAVYSDSWLSHYPALQLSIFYTSVTSLRFLLTHYLYHSLLLSSSDSLSLFIFLPLSISLSCSPLSLPHFPSLSFSLYFYLYLFSSLSLTLSFSLSLPHFLSLS